MDERDLILAGAAAEVVRMLLERGSGAEITSGMLGPPMVEELRKQFIRNRRHAAEWFPASRVDEVMHAMGVSWPADPVPVLQLARGDVDRLRALAEGKRAGDADRTIPATLADLPAPAAELIRRDFPPERWEAAARIAARAPEERGIGSCLLWLLLAEYAAGDVAELDAAVRLAHAGPGTLSSAIGRLRAARRGTSPS